MFRALSSGVALALVAGLTVLAVPARAMPEFIPDLSSASIGSTTTLRAIVREQARLEVPALVVFTVTDVASDTPQDGTALVRATEVVLTPTHRLLVAIAPTSSAFVDAAGKSSWSATKVKWAGLALSGAVVPAGRLAGASEYQPLMSCSAGVASCSATLKFTLEADPSQTTAGSQTLVAAYRVSSVL